MNSNNKCIFCSIINNELKAVKIYEDSSYLAFMDKYPINTGHALVLPKKHHSDIFTMDDLEIGKLFSTVSFLAKGIAKALDAKGLNIGQNNGRAANQIVPHERGLRPPPLHDVYVLWSVSSTLYNSKILLLNSSASLYFF